MDPDLLSDILTEPQPALTRSLLFNLSNSELNTGQYMSREHEHEDGLPNHYSATSTQAGAIISKIEDIFESIVDSVLEEKKELVIRLKTRKRPRAKLSMAAKGTDSPTNEETRAVRFPSKNPQEAWKFSKQ